MHLYLNDKLSALRSTHQNLVLSEVIVYEPNQNFPTRRTYDVKHLKYSYAYKCN